MFEALIITDESFNDFIDPTNNYVVLCDLTSFWTPSKMSDLFFLQKAPSLHLQGVETLRPLVHQRAIIKFTEKARLSGFAAFFSYKCVFDTNLVYLKQDQHF